MRETLAGLGPSAKSRASNCKKSERQNLCYLMVFQKNVRDPPEVREGDPEVREGDPEVREGDQFKGVDPSLG